MAGSVHIVLSEDTSSYQQAAKDIRKALNTRGFDEEIAITPLSSFSHAQVEAKDLIVNIGNAAAKKSSQITPDNTQIYSYLDKSSLPIEPAKYWAAVLLDQPVKRMFDTAVKVVSGRFKNKLVIAVSENNFRLRQDIEALLIPEDIELQVLVIDSHTEPAKVIDKALFNAGALIAIRDERVWSGENAKWMLYQSYKYNVPVIGYSKSFLKAGALVSVYANLKATAEKTAELIIGWQNHNGQFTQEGIHYPRFHVDYNKNIARALNIDITDISMGKEADVRD